MQEDDRVGVPGAGFRGLAVERMVRCAVEEWRAPMKWMLLA